MIEDYTFIFKQGKLKPFDIPELELDGDWDKILADAGFSNYTDFGAQECSRLEIEIYSGPPKYRWLITVMSSGTGLGHFVCEDLPSLLTFLREWMAPLISMRRDCDISEFLDRAEEILFDGQDGLMCAQRHARTTAKFIREMRARKAKVVPDLTSNPPVTEQNAQ